MAGNTVATLALAKRAEVWSAELKEILRDELQGMKYVKWLDQFPDGDTFKIPSLGDAYHTFYTAGARRSLTPRGACYIRFVWLLGKNRTQPVSVFSVDRRCR